MQVGRSGSGVSVLEAFEAPIEPVRLRPMYALGLLVVSGVMIALPLLYIALIGLVGYGAYYHATRHVGMLSGGGVTFRVFGYGAPIVAGAMMILFMVKPLFARRVPIEVPHRLEPHEAPALYAFVDRIAACIGAPMPRSIGVVNQPEAAAGFRRGLRSLLTGELELTVGLPLVAGLDTRQLAGVIAHELGHFAQKAGMRLTYLVRTINAWFARVVYERDVWDERLRSWMSEERHGLWALLGLVAGFGVWVTRGVLGVFMQVGQVVACAMLRQMEYDADRCEVRLAGSETFAATTGRLDELSYGAATAIGQLPGSHAEGRLPDDLPALIVALADHVPRPVRRQMDKALEGRRTGVFDTHPTDRDRMERARRENAPGVFRLEAPSSQLLGNFEELSKRMTLEYYRRVLGAELKVEELSPGQEIVDRHHMLEESRHARNRYFQGLLHPWRPWRGAPTWDEVPPPPAKVLDVLRSLRNDLVAAAPAGREKVRLYVKTEAMLSDARQAQVLLDAGLAVDLTVLPLPVAGRRGIIAYRRQAEAWMADIDHELGELDDKIVSRLHIGLGLLRVEKVAGAVNDAPRLIRHAVRNLDGLRAWHDARNLIMELHDCLAHLWALLSRQDQPSERPASAERITRTASELPEKLTRLRTMLGDVAYPLEHSRQQLSIAEFALGPPIPRSDPRAVAAAAESALDNLMELYSRMMGRLALIAEHVERTCGLPPLEQPDDDELW